MAGQKKMLRSYMQASSHTNSMHARQLSHKNHDDGQSSTSAFHLIQDGLSLHADSVQLTVVFHNAWTVLLDCGCRSSFRPSCCLVV